MALAVQKDRPVRLSSLLPSEERGQDRRTHREMGLPRLEEQLLELPGRCSAPVRQLLVRLSYSRFHLTRLFFLRRKSAQPQQAHVKGRGLIRTERTLGDGLKHYLIAALQILRAETGRIILKHRRGE